MIHYFWLVVVKLLGLYVNGLYMFNLIYYIINCIGMDVLRYESGVENRKF